MLDSTYWCHGCRHLIEAWSPEGAEVHACTMSANIDPERTVSCNMRDERMPHDGDRASNCACAHVEPKGGVHGDS